MKERDGRREDMGWGWGKGWGVEGECERRVDGERNNYTN